MEIAYNDRRPTESLTYNEQRPQLKQQLLEYKQHEALQHTQKPALQYSRQQQQVLQYSQQLQQALQPTALQDIQSKMELGYNPQQALPKTHGRYHQMDFTQPLNYNQHIAQENMQIEPYHSQPAEIEKLEHHSKSFHEAFFNQTERGTKRKKNIGMRMKIKS